MPTVQKKVLPKHQGWDFYNGAGNTSEKLMQFVAAMHRVIDEVVQNDCAEIDVEYSDPDWAGVRNVKVTVRGVNPCA